MASVRAALYTQLSTNAGIQAVAGNPARVYPIKLPQDTPRPAVVYRRMPARDEAKAPEELGHVHDLDGSAGFAVALFKIDCLADTYAAADQLGEALRQCLDGLDQETVAGVTILSVTIDDEMDDFDDPIDGGDAGVFAVSTLYRITYAESVPAPT